MTWARWPWALRMGTIAVIVRQEIVLLHHGRPVRGRGAVGDGAGAATSNTPRKIRRGQAASSAWRPCITTMSWGAGRRPRWSSVSGSSPSCWCCLACPPSSCAERNIGAPIPALTLVILASASPAWPWPAGSHRQGAGPARGRFPRDATGRGGACTARCSACGDSSPGRSFGCNCWTVIGRIAILSPGVLESDASDCSRHGEHRPARRGDLPVISERWICWPMALAQPGLQPRPKNHCHHRYQRQDHHDHPDSARWLTATGLDGVAWRETFSRRRTGCA